MKHTMKQALALFIAVLLATLGPVGALAESIEEIAFDESDEALVVSEDIEPPAEEITVEFGDLEGELPIGEEDLVIELENDSEAAVEDEPSYNGVVAEPFDQAVNIDGVNIAVTANAGAFPAGAALQVTKVEDADIARAVEAVIGGSGVYTHRQYRVEVLDEANNIALPDLEQGVPVVRVEGLNLPADARVAFYDEYAPGAYELGATVYADENAIEFDLVDITVYDIVTVEPLPEQEKQPAEDETEEPAERPAEGETEEPAEQPAEGETEEPAEQPAEGETEEPAEQFAEGETEEESPEEPDEAAPEKTSVARLARAGLLGASSYWTEEDYEDYIGQPCDCTVSNETESIWVEYSHIVHSDSKHWLTCDNNRCKLREESHHFDPDVGFCDVCYYQCPHTNWGDWEDAGNGRHQRTCAKCGYTETAKHSFVIGESQDETGHQVTCSVCGYTETQAHKLQVQPGTIETDTHTLLCACGYTETEAHTFELVAADGVYKKQCACGAVQSTTESAWLGLQQQIDAAGIGDTITLSQDVTATEYDGPLVIEKNITLDLAGYTIDRGLTAAASDGSVITNGGYLTLRGTGTITGGNTTGHGGGILCNAESRLVIEGGVTISGNAAAKNGGGIYVSGKAELTMNGGSVTGNTAGSGSGIYAAGNGRIYMQGGSVTGNSSTYGPGVHPVNGSSFYISGAPVISGNTATSGDHAGAYNLYLRGNTIQVNGALTSGADIRVTTYDVPSDDPVILTQGLSGNGSASYFKSDDTAYKVSDQDGEAALFLNDGKNTISFSIDDSISEIWAEVNETRVKRASEGETVTIHIDPSGSNNTVKTLTVKDADGTKVAVTEITENEEYQFTMPASAVTITANCIEAYDITIVDENGDAYTASGKTFAKDGFTFTRYDGASSWKAEVGSTVKMYYDFDAAQAMKSLSYMEDGVAHSVYNYAEISFAMPAHDVTLTAELETKAAHTITYDPSGFEGYMSILTANNGAWNLMDGPMSKTTGDYVYLSNARWNQSGSYALLGIEWCLPDGTVFKYSEAYGSGRDFMFEGAINMPNCDVTLRPRVASAYKVYDLTDTLPNIVIARVTGNRTNVKAGDTVSFVSPYANQSSLGNLEFVFSGRVRFYRNEAMTDEITGDDLAALNYTWNAETKAGSFIMPEHDVYLVGEFLALNIYTLATPIEHGSATLSVEGSEPGNSVKATQDKAITLTVESDEGYSVKSVEVTGHNAYYVTVTQSETDPNTYTLTPGDSAVGDDFTVNVTFGKPHTITCVTHRGVTPHVMINDKTIEGGLFAGDKAWLTFSDSAGEAYVYGVEMSYTNPETNERITELYEEPSTFIMPDADITLTPKCYDWTWLQEQIDAAADGATVRLPDDIPPEKQTILASADDAGLVIPVNTEITLDLNGWTLNRSLGEAKADGYVIIVDEAATLTVTGGGAIVGGYNSGNGGGIKVERNGTLCLKNVEISGNKAALGGGVYVDEDAALQVQDRPIVHDNQDTSGNNSNVYLPSANDRIVVLDTLVGEGAYPTDIGVTLNSSDNNGVFTSGLSGKGSADMFFSDLDGHAVREAPDGEAELYTAVALTNVPYIDMTKAVRNMVAPVAYSIGSLNEYKLTAGRFYVVDQNWTIDKPIVVSGEARLILMDGCKLTAKAGIIVTLGNTLTIYPQENGTGAINATGKQSAGIGGGMWAGRTPHISKCGTIVIHGGHITAKGDQGSAGIGGGCWATMWEAIDQRDAYEEGFSHGGDVTIYGGTVKAYGSMWWDGNYYSNRKHYSIGAGIGGGPMGNGGSLTVYGGSVTAECTGFSYASQYSSISGIGSGQDFQPDDGWYLENKTWNERGADVKIYGGTVTATSHANAHPIGSSVATVLNERVGGNTDPGTLSIYNTAKVTVTHDGVTETAAAEDRIDACRTAGSATKNDKVTVTISYCSHEQTTYTVTETGHTEHCANCNKAGGVEEAHVYEGESNVCSVCEYASETYEVAFDANGGTGTMESKQVVKDKNFLLPKPAFTAPSDNQQFKEWSVKVGEAKPVLMQPNETITVTADTTVSAVWEQLYAVAVDGQSTIASITTDKSIAAQGETVSVLIRCNDGYTVKEIRAIGADGAEVDVVSNGSFTVNTFTMPACDVTVTVSFDDETPHEHDGITFTLWDRADSLPTESGSYYLAGDVTLTAGNWLLNNGQEISLCLNGHTITNDSGENTAIRMENDSKLSIYDCSENQGMITGGSYGVSLYRGGTLNLYGGTLSGFNATAVNIGWGGSAGKANTVTMYGGVLTGNYDGVNCEYATSQFTMYGGSITGNGGYGVSIVEGAKPFTMTDGIISDNGKDGVYVYSGSSFTMEDGEISGNKYHGVSVYGGTFVMESGSITGNGVAITTNSGGVLVTNGGSFTMQSGEISGNDEYGVYDEYDGSFTVSGASYIRDNAVSDVYLGQSTNAKAPNWKNQIKIAGQLAEDAKIGVRIYQNTTGDGLMAGIFTDGLASNGSADNFFSSVDRYSVFETEDGEAELARAWTITFDSNGGSEVEPQIVQDGKTVHRPEAPTKERYTLENWYQVLGNSVEDGSEMLSETPFIFEEDGDGEIIHGDLTLKAVWEELPTVIIKSANVEFQGLIRLEFTFTFPADVLTDEGAYLTFEKAGTTTTRLVSEGSASGEDVRFMISVPAPEYADDITIKVYDSEGRKLTLKSSKGTDYTENGFVYSVKAYAQKMSVDGSTEQMRRLAKALDDYGAAAQIYFTYGDYSSLSVDSAVTAVTLEDLAPYALTTSGTRPAGVTGAGIMVEFESDNTLRITFKTDGSKPLSDYTFLLDDVEATPTKSGKNAYLQVVNIAAPNLDTAHSFTVSDGTDTYTITASALSYAYTSVKNGNAARQNLGKALYLYNQAANTRFGN